MKTLLPSFQFATLALWFLCGTFNAPAQSLQLVSALSSNQVSISGGGDSFNPVLSRDGRYVLFSSSANNLVTNTNGIAFQALSSARLNIFLRDRTNGTTTLASVNIDGTGGGNGDSFAIGISTNGQFALFESSATNLVANDTNNASDVFVRDLVNNTTALASVSTNGTSGNGVSRSSIMTPNGRYVAFVSAASNLVAGDINGIPDVFVRDLQAGTTVLASVGAMNALGSASESPDISADGKYVVFYSTATNLVAGVMTKGEVYVRDTFAGTTTLASIDAPAIVQTVFGTTNSVSYNHTISDDGNYVAYQASSNSAPSSVLRPGVILRYSLLAGTTEVVNTNALGSKWGFESDYRGLDMTRDGRFIVFLTNLTASPQNNAVCVWDAQSSTTTFVSVDLTSAVSTNFGCYLPQISDNGQFITFFCNATNMTTNVNAGGFHLYVRDMQAGVTALVNARIDGNASGAPTEASTLSSDGRFIAFSSFDSNLTTDDANRGSDIFVRDLVINSSELISARSSALPSLSPNGPSAFSDFSVSANGRYVAFHSETENLTPSDVNGCRDVFLHDMLTGTNFLVSVATNGVGPGNNLSHDPAVSGDGRYVAFTSSSSDLVSGDFNNAEDVFVRDVQSGLTTLVSVDTTGTASGNAASYSPILSSNGRYVLFHSKSSTLASGISSTTYENIFVRDLQSGTTLALITNTINIPLVATMTSDGRYVGYGGANPPLSGPIMYVWDLQLLERIYTNSASATGVALSPDGKRLAYSTATQISVVDLVAKTNLNLGISGKIMPHALQFTADGRFLVYSTGGFGRTNQVNLIDFQSGTNFIVSKSFNSSEAGNDDSDSPTISSDGRFVAYRSIATNIVPGDVNSVPDVFLYDRLSGTTTLMGTSSYGNTVGNNRSLSPVFSGDAQTILFQSWASDIFPQDFNQGGDLFALSLNDTNAQVTFSVELILPSTLTWPVVSGKTYQVQFKTDLNESFWQVVNGGVTIIGDRAYISDLAPISSQKFYRVVAY